MSKFLQCQASYPVREQVFFLSSRYFQIDCILSDLYKMESEKMTEAQGQYTYVAMTLTHEDCDRSCHLDDHCDTSWYMDDLCFIYSEDDVLVREGQDGDSVLYSKVPLLGE